MTDNELLLALSDMIDGKLKAELQPIKNSIMSIENRLDSIEKRMDSIEKRMDSIEKRMDSIEKRMDSIEEELQIVKQEVVGINLHLENITDKNISILAENHLTLINKLNEAIKISDRTLIYEVQVNILTGKVDKLEKEMAEIKNKTA